MLIRDLFWEPAVGELVMAGPTGRSGVRAFDEHPLKVTKRSEIQGVVLFSCQTTGPKTFRRMSTGRLADETPCWTGFYTADQLVPHVDQHAQRSAV